MVTLITDEDIAGSRDRLAHQLLLVLGARQSCASVYTVIKVPGCVRTASLPVETFAGGSGVCHLFENAMADTPYPQCSVTLVGTLHLHRVSSASLCPTRMNSKDPLRKLCSGCLFWNSHPAWAPCNPSFLSWVCVCSTEITFVQGPASSCDPGLSRHSRSHCTQA